MSDENVDTFGLPSHHMKLPLSKAKEHEARPCHGSLRDLPTDNRPGTACDRCGHVCHPCSSGGQAPAVVLVNDAAAERAKMARRLAQTSYFDRLGAAHDGCGRFQCCAGERAILTCTGAHAWHQPAAAVAALWREWTNPHGNLQELVHSERRAALLKAGDGLKPW
eukprot:355524-Chlamydomonas_euryale.AAC.13